MLSIVNISLNCVWALLLGEGHFLAVFYLWLQYCSSQETCCSPHKAYPLLFIRCSKGARCAVGIWDHQVVDCLSPEEVVLSKGIVHRAYLVLAMVVYWRQANLRWTMCQWEFYDEECLCYAHFYRGWANSGRGPLRRSTKRPSILGHVGRMPILSKAR